MGKFGHTCTTNIQALLITERVEHGMKQILLLLSKLIKLEVKDMNKQINSDSNFGFDWNPKAHRWVCKDHMEFFIEKV